MKSIHIHHIEYIESGWQMSKWQPEFVDEAQICHQSFAQHRQSKSIWRNQTRTWTFFKSKEKRKTHTWTMIPLLKTEPSPARLQKNPTTSFFPLRTETDATQTEFSSNDTSAASITDGNNEKRPGVGQSCTNHSIHERNWGSHVWHQIKIIARTKRWKSFRALLLLFFFWRG